MVTTVTDNSPQSINTSLFSLDKEVQEIKKVTGNAATATTAKKVANALTVNGKTYDGSEAVDAGVQTVANGGTGATDAESGFNTLADGVRDSTTPEDGEKMLLKPSGTWYKTTCLDFWNYIKGKISSVLGLTKDNYGGKASTAGTADNADMVDGYHASESAQGSTVGVRDANGYFNARIFHDDWGEENINTFSNPKIMFKETNDGYIRNTDPSNVKVGAASSADTATTAAKLGRNGNTDIPMTFNWSGQGGQPSWLWGGNDGSNMYVYNPSNFSVNRASTAGTADKVASAGASTMWIYGRAEAICKTTSAGAYGGWKTLASIKTSSGSIEIGNLSGEDYIRIVYSSDADVNAGNNNVTQLLFIRRGNIETPNEFIANSSKALSKMVIPIGAPSPLEDGCIWIER